ncbi:ATP-binding cassette domain-containing protein [Bullifex porci]|uniref:ATP-binding cassette domain-containing protein n=1 Tax=Bullifex porci TaxID=2606638 RepID=UPI0023F1AE76|nr:ABC transporter ATP-binding protein [Bullifex porci]MDD7254633.1 ABC transporter ATP-binding protein [Bullifex porci]MDY2741852.1 ABC transporter ATP-binding protein [Bullifex porci]
MFEIVQFIFLILSIFGMWGIFRKCGEKSWKALIPFYRTYILSKCADKKDEGRVLLILDLFNNILSFSVSAINIKLSNVSAISYRIIVILSLIVSISTILYTIKIYSALCVLFKQNKWWSALMMLEIPIYFFWGVMNRFQPTSTIQEREVRAASLSEYEEKESNEGLTINIKSRTVSSLTKGKKVLLRDIHMHIPQGRMVMLLGGSGAGKTTFLNAITGFEKADATVLLNGRDVYKDFESLKYEIGFVPQQDLIRYNDTVEKTISDSADLRLPLSISKQEEKKKINEVMDIFGLKAVCQNLVGKQSGGQKKRISIASEFISNPYLFILDEPDSGLDGVLARNLMERLHAISRTGRIVIVITHSPDRVKDLFDDVIILAKDAERTGRLVFYGSIDEANTFFNTDKLEEMVRMINRKEEGGEGLADELIEKFGGLRNE